VLLPRCIAYAYAYAYAYGVSVAPEVAVNVQLNEPVAPFESVA
jgi:hypothetical protein